MPYTAIAQELGSTGICVFPDFASGEFLNELRSDLKALRQNGQFEAAGVGKGANHQVLGSVRLNELCWLDRHSPTPTQVKLWNRLDELKTAINRTLFLGIHDFEGHYAIYPPGGFYQRHLDTFSQDPSRIVSFVLYLNENWKPEDGGALRIYQGESHVDVRPMGGNLACFLSQEIEHEVMTSHAERLSFTGWFKR